VDILKVAQWNLHGMENNMKTQKHLSYLVIVAGLLLNLNSGWSANQAMNFFGNYTTRYTAQDITKPVADRSYFVTSIEPTSDGAKLILDIYHGKLDSKVSTYIQVAINDGNGDVRAIPILQLDDQVADNPTNYYSHREYDLKYTDLNAALQKVLPQAAQAAVQIGPGTPLFAFAQFHDYSHQWGSIGRGGIFYMPEDLAQKSTSHLNNALNARRPTELDLAYPIPQTMIPKYNDLAAGTGLKEGGQIRSRMESEGKFQIPLDQVTDVKKTLFDIANDASKAAQVLGPDWTIQPNLRYMKKDPADSSKLLLDSNGLPIPDPMVDTYYDNDKYDAAKKDMAIRYRWTEGNRTGAWNFKPGLTHVSASGVADRLEFGIDTTDGKPETVKKFADSMDPLNPLRMIRELVPGSTPSDFLKPSAEISDNRYKFELKHKNGLVIEVSLDEVTAKSLRDSNLSPVEYCQMEMDIEHLATASANVAQVASVTGSGTIDTYQQQYLNQLTGAAFLDGRPVLHSTADLNAGSPVKTKHQNDFTIAEAAVTAIREATLGKNWLAGPQKYALAASALGVFPANQASASVKAISKSPNISQKAGTVPSSASCKAIFGG